MALLGSPRSMSVWVSVSNLSRTVRASPPGAQRAGWCGVVVSRQLFPGCRVPRNGARPGWSDPTDPTQPCRPKFNCPVAEAARLRRLVWPLFAGSISRRSILLSTSDQTRLPLNLSILISGGKETNKDSPVTASEAGTAQIWNLRCSATANCSFEKRFLGGRLRLSCLEQHVIEGDNPVHGVAGRSRCAFEESGCLGMQPKMGGKLHLRLNIGTRPIANKYREGKMKRTLERELKSTWNRWKGNEWS